MPKAFVQRLQDFARISLPSDKIPTGKVSLPSQMREQMSGPDLHVFTLKFLATEKLFFPHKKYSPNFFDLCLLLFNSLVLLPCQLMKCQLLVIKSQ